GAGQRIDRIADPLPFLLGVQVQAALLERVVGDDQAIAALARDQLAVGGGHRQPTLVINCDGGLTLEHEPCTHEIRWKAAIEPRKTTKNRIFPLLPTLAPPERLS